MPWPFLDDENLILAVRDKTCTANLVRGQWRWDGVVEAWLQPFFEYGLLTLCVVELETKLRRSDACQCTLLYRDLLVFGNIGFYGR